MRLTCLLLALLTLPAFARWQAVVSPAGAVRLLCDDRVVGTLAPGAFEEGWQYATLGARAVPVPDDAFHGLITLPGGAVIETTLRCEEAAGSLRLVYRLVPRANVRLNSLHVDMAIPTAQLVGGQFAVDGMATPFPAEHGEVALAIRRMSALDLRLPAETALGFRFAAPVAVLVQDDRRWGDSFSIRIGVLDGNAQVWPTGKALDLDFTLVSQDGLAVEYDGPVTITAGPEWIPLDDELDIEPGSALDFSKLVPWHAPAGQLGRVIATADGCFAFAKQPDIPVRFYGVNLCFTGQYLSHDQADRLAERLLRLGYNSVRLHHYESNLVERTEDATRLKPEALDQLDYLAAALKRRGLYISTDLFVSRPVPAAALWEGARGDVGMDEFKMAVPVNSRAFANYLLFTRNLLTHVNPYTGMRWADDPSLAWLCLINEGNTSNFIGRLPERLKPDWTAAWNRWLAANYQERPALERAIGKLPPGQQPADGTVPLPALDDTPAGNALARFLVEQERDFVARATVELRRMGCTALITDANGWSNPLAMAPARRDFDYVDDHFYIDHPHFLERPWNLPSRNDNTNPAAGGLVGGTTNAFVRIFGKPFTLSEYNYAAPSRYRGQGGLLTGALAALQDWSGIWRFAYSHSRDAVSTPSRLDYFNLAGDPLNQAADRAALCLFRRGDLRAAPHAVAITVPADVATNRSVVPAWHRLALITRVGLQAGEGIADLSLPAAAAYEQGVGRNLLAALRDRGWLATRNPTDLASRFYCETGEFMLDTNAGVFIVDTPRTAGGYLPAGGQIHLPAVSLAVADTGATVWVSSVDGVPIHESRRLLVTHLTEMVDNNTRFGDRARETLLAWGTLPHLLRAGTATLTLRLAHPEQARAWALSPGGRRLRAVPVHVENGALVLKLDVNDAGSARLHYEIAL